MPLPDSPPSTFAPERRPVRRIVIVGGGTAGWMTAACLGKTLGKTHEIRLVESDEIGTVGVGEATIPTLLTFHELLGVNEQEFMAAAQATFKLGIRFEGWRDLGQDYIHSFGLTGKDHWTAGFQHFWHKGRQRGLAGDYGDYCLELQAAQHGRFAHLPRAGMNYAYHLDASLYARFLRLMAERSGVQRIEGRIVDVQADPARATVLSVQLESGARIDGDLFIDCSGFRALLIGQTLGVPYEDWLHWLPCDRAVAVQTTSVGEPVPYTRSIAHDAGWRWRIPLQHRVGNGLVYCSSHLDAGQASERLLSLVEGDALTQPRHLQFVPGQRQAVWHGNCVAIGLSSGFIEPLESTSIHLIQRGIIRLLQTFPSDGISAADVDEYNQQARTEIEHIRDFIVLHYHLTERNDSAFWQGCRSMDIPATLRHRMALFSESGRVFRHGNELFAENSWIQVMLGQGILPQRHHPVADLMGDAELSKFLGGIRQAVDRTCRQLPMHQAYLQQYCPAPAPVR